MRRSLGLGLGVLAVAEVVAAVALTVAVGWSFETALHAFVVSNSVMGVAFAGCGAVIAWHRPENPIGWLFVADGLGHATTALVPLAQALQDADAPVAAVRLVMTVAAWAWPWSIALFLPLALLLFPDGRPPSPRWRPVIWAVVLTSPLFAVEVAAAPEPLVSGLPVGYLTLPQHAALGPLWTVSELRTFVALGLAVAALLVRYRRAGEPARRQLLWLLLATIVAVAFTLPWGFIAGTPIVVLFAIPLIPVAVTVAVVRHQLLDIRLVVSRALTWVLLSVVVVVTYAGLVAVLDRFVSAQLGRSAVATVVIALLAAPVLPRLQRAVDRAMYGDRGDPARIASRVGQRLAAGSGDSLADVAVAIRDALRLPYVAISVDGAGYTAGSLPAGVAEAVPLAYRGEAVGELVVGLRPGERALATADRAALAVVAAPLAVAIHATRLSDQLQASREQIVAAREEERRRIRRDLHDGLGPALTGIALTADAAGNLLTQDPVRARELLAALRSGTGAAIADIRRLVEDLRPPALDELGLVAALRQRADQLAWRTDGAALAIRIDAPPELPALPAAIEVAAYRIATEALNNVARHAGARTAVLRLTCGDTVEIEVVDDGAGDTGWRPGVGLRTMAERAAELGGSFEAGPGTTGGRVYAALPLPVPRHPVEEPT